MFNQSIGDGAYNVLTVLVNEGKITTAQVAAALDALKDMPEKDVQGFYEFQNDAIRPLFTRHGYGLE
jgi:hypothetical protein